MPFSEDGVKVERDNFYIVFQSKHLTVHFDGDQLLKFHECGKVVCGMCGNKNDDVRDDSFDLNKFLAMAPNRNCK